MNFSLNFLEEVAVERSSGFNFNAFLLHLSSMSTVQADQEERWTDLFVFTASYSCNCGA